MTTKLAILGATGSVGQSALEVVRRFPDRFEVVCLAAGSDHQALAVLAGEFRPGYAALADESGADALSKALSGSDCAVSGGEDGIIRAIVGSGADMLVSAAVGVAGLAPTLAAIEAGMDIALANKEVLVAGGALVTMAVDKAGVKLIPVDSEHSAVFQCLRGESSREMRRLVLTASGGPFRGMSREELEKVTAEQALEHPTWNMGEKVTLDSATLMNKAFEVIEAHWLFGVEYDDIDVLVHPQSLVHSMVEFVDGSMIAQIGAPDMRLPIQYALTLPERLDGGLPEVSLADMAALTFEQVDREAFPCLDLGYQAGRMGETAGAALIGANEAARDLFLQGMIRFPEIPGLIATVLDQHRPEPGATVQMVLDAEQHGRKSVLALAGAENA